MYNASGTASNTFKVGLSNGITIHTGDTAPGSGDGIVGDIFFVTDGETYQKTASGWVNNSNPIRTINDQSPDSDGNLDISTNVYDAVADGIALYDVATTAASTTVTSASASFDSGDVGKAIMIWRAGTSEQPHFSTIASVTNSTTIEITDAAVSTVSDKRAVYGTDNATALQAALDVGGTLVLGEGTYMTSSLTMATFNYGRRNVFPSIIGKGKDKTRLVKADNTDPFLTETVTGLDVYVGEYRGFTLEGGGIKFGDRTETLADGSGQAPKVGGVFSDLVFLDNSTSGGGGGAIGNYICLDLAKCFNTTIMNCDFYAPGYGIVNTGCDNTIIIGNRFNSCRYGAVWDKSAQTFGNGVSILSNYFVGESEASSMILKTTNRKVVVRNNEFEVSNVTAALDFSEVDWPAFFGSNVDTGCYTITMDGNGVDVGVSAGGHAHRVETSQLYSLWFNNQRWTNPVDSVFLEDSVEVASVPIVVNVGNTRRMTFGSEGAGFGDEWTYYAPENPYSAQGGAVAHFSGRTPDAVWTGWPGNADIRYAGDSLIIPAAYASDGMFLTENMASNAASEVLFNNGETYEVSFLVRTQSGTDTVSCQYQYHNGSTWATGPLQTYSLNSDWDLYRYTFVAQTGTTHGLLFDRSTAISDIEIRDVNIRKMRLNPQFLVTLASDTANDKTGNGTAYTIVFDAEIADDGDHFNTGTGTFTAPSTGQYAFSTNVSLANVINGSSHTDARIEIVTSNRTYRYEFNPAAISTSNNRASVNFQTTADMDAGDTAYISVTVYNSTQTVGFASGQLTQFSGYLISSGGAV